MRSEIYVPAYITVHLGRPREDAQNVTVPFIDYIKNVASSEIYPTWPENALEANVYCQISFALNRIYTEWYRSRGYTFDITGSPAVDQAYVYGRDIFGSIDRLVNRIFNDYIRRENAGEPLFAQYCDGRTATCDGLSQWGSLTLAKEGKTPYEILTYYYGSGLQIIRDAPILPLVESYPGMAIRLGDSGDNVRYIQNRLNAVSANYPSIQKLIPDGIFGQNTYDAVSEFQQIFELSADGVVGKATWYKIIYVYSAVRKLAELDSLGADVESIPQQFERTLRPGMVGNDVKLMQYFLKTIANYNPVVQSIALTGTFNAETEEAVKEFQRYSGLTQTGTVDLDTFKLIYDEYVAINLDSPLASRSAEAYPGYPLRKGSVGDDVRKLQIYLLVIREQDSSLPPLLADGIFSQSTEDAVIAFQQQNGLEADGVVGELTWNMIAEEYDNVLNITARNAGQYPGYELK